MQKVVSLLCLLGLVNSALAGNVTGNIYAVLIAGSNGYWNYRHQADTAHAFQVLKNHGIKQENIITMMYDDVAYSDENPFPGKLFNAPNGNEVYNGVKIDYKGDDVNPDNFLAILKGDAKNVQGGTGRVLKSTKNDKVFIYFVDHGDTGIVAVIDDILTAKQLNETLQTMYDKNMYGELVFYLEACESGSMFEDILPSNVNILAVTASNASESSWGYYCEDPVLDTCLGDLFSISWMEDSDVEDLNKETLKVQYEVVKKRTDLSNVMKYGDLTITAEVVGNFQGKQAAPKAKLARAQRNQRKNTKKAVAWPSKDIPLRTLDAKLKKTKEPEKRAQLLKQLDQMKTKRMYHDMHTRALIQKLMPGKAEVERQTMLSHKASKVVDLECHHEVVTAYHQSCFNLAQNPYAMKVAGTLNNLCASGIPSEKIVETIKSHCAHKNTKMVNIH